LKLGGKWGAMARAASLSKSGLRTSANEKGKLAQTKNKPLPVLTGIVVNQYPPAGQKVASGTEVYFEVKQ